MDAVNQALQTVSQNLDPTNYQTPVIGGIRRFNAQTFGMPQYADPSLSPDQRQLAMVQAMGLHTAPVGGANPKIIQNAIKVLRGNLTPEDIQTIGQFAEKVESGQGDEPLGLLGQQIQSLTQNALGPKAANWTNDQIKNALDIIVKKSTK